MPDTKNTLANPLEAVCEAFFAARIFISNRSNGRKTGPHFFWKHL